MIADAGVYIGFAVIAVSIALAVFGPKLVDRVRGEHMSEDWLRELHRRVPPDDPDAGTRGD